MLRHRQPRNRQAAGLAAQKRDLTAAGAERIFGEQVSSTAKRVKLAECLAFRREGDVLTITKPDRLARSTAETAVHRGGQSSQRGCQGHGGPSSERRGQIAERTQARHGH